MRRLGISSTGSLSPPRCYPVLYWSMAETAIPSPSINKLNNDHAENVLFPTCRINLATRRRTAWSLSPPDTMTPKSPPVTAIHRSVCLSLHRFRTDGNRLSDAQRGPWYPSPNSPPPSTSCVSIAHPQYEIVTINVKNPSSLSLAECPDETAESVHPICPESSSPWGS